MRLSPREQPWLIKSYEDGVLFKSIGPQDATSPPFPPMEITGYCWVCGDNYTPAQKVNQPSRRPSSTPDSAWEHSQKLFCVLFPISRIRINLRLLTDSRDAKHVKVALQGEKIKGYPTMEDIEDRLELYDIKL